jgi:hypothetical protein
MGRHVSSSLVPEIPKLPYRVGVTDRLASDYCLVSILSWDYFAEHHYHVRRWLLSEALPGNIDRLGSTRFRSHYQHRRRQNSRTLRGLDLDTAHPWVLRHLDSAGLSGTT